MYTLLLKYDIIGTDKEDGLGSNTLIFILIEYYIIVY